MKYRTKLKGLNSVERRKPETNKIYDCVYEKRCIFCGKTEDTREFKGKYVCADCIDQVNTVSNLSNN